MKIYATIMAVWLVSTISFAKGAKAEAPGIEKMYQSKCSSCHGPKGEGSAKFAKMMKVEEGKLILNSATTAKTADADLTKTILQGHGRMPAFQGKITDDEAKQLVQYIKKFKK